MKKEFALAFAEVLEDKQLPQEIVVEALEAAMVSAYRKTVNASSAQQIQAKFDLETGEVQIFAEKEVVDDVQDERTEVTLEEALKYEPDTEIGNIVIVESTPEDFGRVAAQTARQVIQQRIREAERDAQFEHFQHLAGEVVNGVVQAVNSGGITLGLDRKAEGIMPRSQQIRGERFRVHDRVRALLLEVKNTPRGPQLVLSRAHKNFLRRLLEDEVPEIYHGLVEIRSIAREPGYRSKVAVSAMQPGIDPVGACVGIRGVRIQAIVRELNDEKIDVIEWNPDPSAFIAKALSPARVTGVYLDESNETKTATVVVPEDQLSLAIGRDGQNARLAAKLTSWRIDIKSLPEAASDALFKVKEEEEFAEEAADLVEMVGQIESILKKKDEGRDQTKIHPPLPGMILEPFGVLDPLVSGFVGDQQLEMPIPELVDQVDGMLDPFALNNSRRLEDQKVPRDKADPTPECMGILFVGRRRVFKIQHIGNDHRREACSQGQLLLSRRVDHHVLDVRQAGRKRHAQVIAHRIDRKTGALPVEVVVVCNGGDQGLRDDFGHGQTQG